MILIRILLIPVSVIYSVIIFIRNKLYDFGILKSHKISKPVISIGNITTGGTGKTPLTIIVSDYYLSKGKKVGIISRGYGRKSKDIVVVSNGENIITDPEIAGDELILISNELIKKYRSGFSAAAGSDRVRAADILISKFNPDVIILDDAFQNRRIKRDTDILIIDSKDFKRKKLINYFTLPSGNKRESLSSIKRADVIVQNNKQNNQEILEELKNSGKEVILMRYKTEYFIDNKNSILQNTNQKAVVFSGIADDESFVKMVMEKGLDVETVLKFSDHHNYSQNDIDAIKGKLSGNMILITSEKDFVRLRKYADFVNNFPVYYLKLNAELTDEHNILYSKLDELLKW